MEWSEEIGFSGIRNTPLTGSNEKGDRPIGTRIFPRFLSFFLPFLFPLLTTKTFPSFEKFQNARFFIEDWKSLTGIQPRQL